MKIKKGDKVTIRKGQDRGKSGIVTQVFPRLNKVIIEGLNLKKKRQKPRRSGEKGQVISVPHPLDASNVGMIDPRTNKLSRIGYKILANKKIRITRKSQVEV